MSSWGNTDNKMNAPKWATTMVNLRPTQANANSLFDNTTANSFAVTLADGSVRLGNTTIGLFAIDPNEEQVAESGAHGPHSGWTLRTVGQGGRAGRVTHEVLVALANVVGDSDGQTYPNVAFTLAMSGNQSVNSSGTFANVASFTVTPTITAGNTAAVFSSYNWQYNNASGSYGWQNIPANTTNIHFANTAGATLFAMPGTTANNTNVFRVIVTDSADGVSVTSANVTLSVPA